MKGRCRIEWEREIVGRVVRGRKTWWDKGRVSGSKAKGVDLAFKF